MVVDCQLVREVLSCRLDGEALQAALTAGELEAHLALCVECRAWDARADELRSGCRLEKAPPAPDVRAELLRLFDSEYTAKVVTGRLFAVLRVLLVIVAALQLATVIPMLMLGHDRDAPVHVAHEMGSFELAVALGLLAVVYRPAWAVGMAWFTAAAALALIGTAVGDLTSGTTTMTDEAPHLLVVVAAVLLIALARRGHPPSGASEAGWRIPRLIWPRRALAFRHWARAVTMQGRSDPSLAAGLAGGRRRAA